MDMPEADELSPMTKMRSSTSIVRQARRRIRTRENPSIDLHSLTPSPVGDEVIKVEEPRSSRLLKKQPIYLPQIEPNPVSGVQRTLSHKQRSQTPIDDYIEDDEVEEDLQEEYDDADLEVSQLLESAELINEDSDEFLDTIEYEEEKQQQPPPKMSQQKQPRCLVAPAKLEEGTMYIKAPPSPVKRQPATPQLVNRFVMVPKLIPFQTTDDSQATSTYSFILVYPIYNIYICLAADSVHLAARNTIRFCPPSVSWKNSAPPTHHRTTNSTNRRRHRQRSCPAR